MRAQPVLPRVCEYCRQGPAGICPQVTVLAPSQLTERLCERREPGLSLSIVRGDIREHADASQTLSLLRPRRERPKCRRAADRFIRSRSFLGLFSMFGLLSSLAVFVLIGLR